MDDQMLRDDRLKIDGREGTYNAYVVRPSTLPAPAVVVLHEVFGVNADIRQHCDQLAQQGFLAVAPDLFWRLEPGVDLSVTSTEDWDHGVRLYQAFDRESAVEDIKECIDKVASMPECAGKVALVGYCLGGLMTFLTVQRYRVDAAVAFHGAETEKYLGGAGGLHAPLLMHLAKKDEFMPVAAQDKIKLALDGKPNVTIYTYPGQYHAFSRINGAHYNSQAAALANHRTSKFLEQHLK